MAKDITLKTRNGETRYPKTVTALIYENGTGKTLQTIIDKMRQVDTQTDTRTQHFKADVTSLDTLKNKTDIGLYNYVGTGWRGSVSVCYDSADNVSQVALSSSTPSYNGNTLTWLSAQPCAMARTYTNGAWSHWEKVGAPVVNDLTTGGTDKALSAEMGKTLKDGLDALGPKLSKIENGLNGLQIKDITEDGFVICDTTGKVLIRLDILDTKGGFGENLIAAINALIQSGTSQLRSDIEDIENGLSAMNGKLQELPQLKNIVENGIYICNNEGKAIVRLDVLDSRLIGENLIAAIKSVVEDTLSEAYPTVVDCFDEGTFLVNDQGEAIMRREDDGRWFVAKKHEGAYLTHKGNLASGDVWVLGNNSVKNSKRMMFCGDVTSFTSITLGHGHGSDYSSYGLSAKQWSASRVVIDDTNVVVYNQASSETSNTYTHGLTIANNIQVEIKKDEGATAIIKIVSNGELFEQEITWDGSQGDLFLASGSTLANCVFSWTSGKLQDGIWLFGDSNFSLTATDRWTSYIINDGYKNISLNGWSGAGTMAQYMRLKDLLKMATPKMLIWCLGNNDPDTDTSVNKNWNDVFIVLKKICREKNIELILNVLPAVSGGVAPDSDVPAVVRKHNFKNAIIRASGYRYIDFEVAVGADPNEGTWYANMLSSDGLHPSVKGAKALYHRAICDVPELTQR